MKKNIKNNIISLIKQNKSEEYIQSKIYQKYNYKYSIVEISKFIKIQLKEIENGK